MLDYIFLDFDGPLLDGKLRHYYCYKDIIMKYGGDLIDIDEYWDMKRSKVKRDVLLEKSKFENSYDVFYNEWIENIEKEEYLKYDILKPSVNDTLKKWKKLTSKIVLVTMRQSRETLIYQLKNLNIYDLFDEIIDCSPIKGMNKYDVLKGKEFQKAIFIGDTEEDIKTAKLLKIPSIAILNGLRKKEFLEADYYYNEIKDIDLEIMEGL